MTETDLNFKTIECPRCHQQMKVVMSTDEKIEVLIAHLENLVRRDTEIQQQIEAVRTILRELIK